MFCVQLKNNCTSNSQGIARGETKCNFDYYEYNYSLIASKYMRLPTDHIALPMTLYPHPYDRCEIQQTGAEEAILRTLVRQNH